MRTWSLGRGVNLVEFFTQNLQTKDRKSSIIDLGQRSFIFISLSSYFSFSIALARNPISPCVGRGFLYAQEIWYELMRSTPPEVWDGIYSHR